MFRISRICRICRISPRCFSRRKTKNLRSLNQNQVKLADLSRPFGLVLLAKQKFEFVFFGCGYCWVLHFLVHIWLGTGAVLILVDKRGTALDWQATNLTDAVEQFWVQTWKFNHVNILNFNQLLSSMVYILETLQILKLKTHQTGKYVLRLDIWGCLPRSYAILCG